MTIETATYVNDLQPVNPPSTDPTSQGDDHLRLIKQVLQNQFKNASRQFAIPTTSIVTTSGTVAQSMDGGTILVSTAAGAITMTLPGLAAGDAGWSCNFIKTSTDLNPMFLKAGAGNVQSGQYSVAQARRCIPGQFTKAVWTGANWFLNRVNSLPIGAIAEFYGTTLPVGWEWPNGQTLATVATNYPEYNAVYGTGGTPDLRGFVSCCLDNLGGTAAGRLPSGFISGSTLGATGGVDGVTLTTTQMPSHYHTASVADPGHTHNFNQSGGLGVSSYVYTNTSPQYFYYQGGGQGAQQYQTFIQSNTTGTYLTSSNGTNTVNSAGGGGIHSNLQPTAMMAKILVVE